MIEPTPDIETLFSDIASVTPSQEATAKALARAKPVITADKPRGRWLLPASIAAALLVAAGLTLPFVLPRHASAQEALAATLKATAAYKGWVHLKTPNGKPRAAWNTINGDRTKFGVAAPEDVEFIKAQAGEVAFYSTKHRTIFLTSLNPIQGRRMQNTVGSMPLNLPELITRIEAAVGEANVHVKETAERGMNRFDIDFPFYAADRLRKDLLAGDWPMLPSIVWVDPKTGLIGRMSSDSWEKGWPLSYGDAAFNDVYDVGAPRDAKVVDTRATREVLAVYERVMNRTMKDYPDGLLLIMSQLGNDLDQGAPGLLVCFRSEKQWAIRNYAVTLGAAENGKVQWFGEPKDAASILASMAHVLPKDEHGGDGQHAWNGRFEPKTGAVSHTEFIWQDSNSFTSETKPGKGFVDPDRARISMDISPTFHMSYFSPKARVHAFSPATRLELMTSPDRPGLTALHVPWVYYDTKRLLADSEDWFDPAHQDQFVESIITSYTFDAPTTVRRRVVTRYEDYATLPDGRTYPTSMRTWWYEPDAQGKLVPANNPDLNNSMEALEVNFPGKSTVRFFPGGKLPEIPAPAAAPIPASPAPASAPALLRKP